MAEGKYVNIHQALIDRCKARDRQAQFEIYKLYYKSMFNTCLRIVNDTTEAEDVMQEAFFKAFEKIDTYRNEVSFGAWLKRIVVNSSLDQLKKRKIQVVQLDSAFGVKDEEPLISDDVEPESVEVLKKAIDLLPEGFKLAINLLMIEGYSHEEFAEMFGITTSTSRSQLARAKKRLIELLNKQHKTK